MTKQEMQYIFAVEMVAMLHYCLCCLVSCTWCCVLLGRPPKVPRVAVVAHSALATTRPALTMATANAQQDTSNRGLFANGQVRCLAQAR